MGRQRGRKKKRVRERKRENDRIISKTPQARKMKGPHGNNERDGTLSIHVECVESGTFDGAKEIIYSYDHHLIFI